MRLYTTCFANIGRLPDSVISISICGRPASWYQGLQYKVLAPKYGFFKEYRRTRNKEVFTQHFYEEVLAPLSADAIVHRLSELSGGKDVALVCHEEPGAFCHRHLVADWLTERGYPTQEWDPDTPQASQE